MTSSPTTLDEIYRHIITVNLGQSAPADGTLGVLLLALGNALQAGTSGQMPYSYLGTFLSAPVAVGSGATMVWDHPADQLVGADLEISSDGKTITVLTNGLYVVTLAYYSQVSNADALGYGQLGIQATSAEPTNLLAYFGASVGYHIEGTLLFTTNVNNLTTPPAKFLAGDTMTVVDQGSMTAGAGHAQYSGSTNFFVSRVA